MDEKKPGIFKRFSTWLRLKRLSWAWRHGAVKRIAKLAPEGQEISLDAFLGKEKPVKQCGHTSIYAGKWPTSEIVETGYFGEEKCEHGVIRRNCGTSFPYPKKAQYEDGTTAEMEIRSNEECQRAFKELIFKQFHPEVVKVECLHCKKERNK